LAGRTEFLVGVTIMASNKADGAHTWLELPPTARQNWSAAAVVAVTLVAFAVLATVAGRPLAQLNAFFPSLDAIVFVTDLTTAVLLFTQFSISRSRALLALACGYLFTALIVVPHALTFSGAFSPTGLLGAGLQTGSWLFIFWHVGFAAGLLAYAVFKEERRAEPIAQASTLPAIGLSVASVFGLVCSLTWLATGGEALLPPIILDESRISPVAIYPVSFAILITAAALAVLSVRRRSVLDQWLMVVALVSIAELIFSGLLPSVRFSVGFYAGRIFALITSSIVLIVLLAETTWLHVRLARSNAMLQREKDNKLMNLDAVTSSIAHEVRQPLAAIMTNGEAALALLGHTSPDLEEVRSTLDDVVINAHRAGQVLNDVRVLFGNATYEQAPVDVNEMILAAMRAVRGELKDHGVAARVELASELPLVVGNKGQLQEVLVNLLQNAIEAMDSVKDDRRVLQIRAERDGGKAIKVEVEDSGTGIDPDVRDGIFDAFVTTKPHGMGLGLAICRMIIERHGGQLSASPAPPGGTIFRIVLPQGNFHH
jgi:signal transduction histidine kinase